MSDTESPGSVRTAIGSTGVAVLTIDNPRRYNAVTGAMLDDITAALARLADDPTVRAVVVRGSGAHFCAGMDIRELRSARKLGIRMEDRVTDTEEALAAFPKPTIAAITGYCIGGGAQLALACDIRIATTGSEFAVTPAKLGVVYPARTITRMVGLLGPGVAKQLVITGDRIDAETALRVGFVAEVVADDRLDARTTALAETIVARSSITQRAAKQMIDAAARGGIDRALEDRWTNAPNPDLDIGLDAFLTRTVPRFGGIPG